MNTPSPRLTATTGLLAGAALLTFLTACISENHGRRGGYRSGPTVQVQTAVLFEDDYDYYPGYEVYYSRNRHEYVYRDRNQWVRRAEPDIVSLNVLLASPSVRVDFRDSPERHHDSVVRSYPKNWKRQDNKRGDQDDRRHDQKKRHDGKGDAKNDRDDDRR